MFATHKCLTLQLVGVREGGRYPLPLYKFSFASPNEARMFRGESSDSTSTAPTPEAPRKEEINQDDGIDEIDVGGGVGILNEKKKNR